MYAAALLAAKVEARALTLLASYSAACEDVVQLIV
jgi:hypothetical protein